MASQTFTVELIVTPHPGVRDPQAEAVGEALRGLDGVVATDLQVHCVGRYLRLQLSAADAGAAQARVEALCRELLVNPHLETFQLRLTEAGA